MREIREKQQSYNAEMDRDERQSRKVDEGNK